MWRNGCPSEEMSAKLKLMHSLIKRAIDVMPMIPVTLRKQIRVEFPYYKQPSYKIVAYIENLLGMLEYCPSMVYDILELILENLLQIDVNVSREQIDEAEEDEETWREPTDDDSDKMRHPVAETLDMCMEKVFEYFHSKLKEDSETDKNQQKMITQVIINYFDEQILKTHTKHVHFVLFYIASFRVSFNIAQSIAGSSLTPSRFRNLSSPNS